MVNIPEDMDFVQEEKNIIRVQHDKEHPYVMMNRKTACDFSLALDTQGLLLRLLCNVDNWEINLSHLMRINRIGKDKLRRMLRELIVKGYAYCYQDRDKGMYVSTVWLIFETAKTPGEIKKLLPNTENTYKVNTLPVNPPQIRKKRTRKTKRKEREELSPSPALASSSKKIERALHVMTNEEEHQSLLEKYGEDKAEEAYLFLSEWKEDTMRSKWKKSDYKSIMRWVLTALHERKVKEKKMKDIGVEEDNVVYCQRIVDNYNVAMAPSRGVILERISTGLHMRYTLPSCTIPPVLVKYGNGFQDRVDLSLSKWRLK